MWKRGFTAAKGTCTCEAGHGITMNHHWSWNSTARLSSKNCQGQFKRKKTWVYMETCRPSQHFSVCQATCSPDSGHNESVHGKHHTRRSGSCHRCPALASRLWHKVQSNSKTCTVTLHIHVPMLFRFCEILPTVLWVYDSATLVYVSSLRRWEIILNQISRPGAVVLAIFQPCTGFQHTKTGFIN